MQEYRRPYLTCASFYIISKTEITINVHLATISPQISPILLPTRLLLNPIVVKFHPLLLPTPSVTPIHQLSTNFPKTTPTIPSPSRRRCQNPRLPIIRLRRHRLRRNRRRYH